MKNYPKCVLALALSSAALVPGTAMATNGYQLIGIGSYQKSVGGAVTANPGSAMTAITNPAGMARIGPRADFSMELFLPDRDVDFSATGGDTRDSDADAYGIPALGWTAPISDGNGELYFGGGMYGTSGMGVDYAQTFYAPAAASPTGSDLYFDGYSSIAFWQMAPTLAWNATDRFSVGAALNFDYQSVAFKQRILVDGDAATPMQALDLSKKADAFGYGISVGAMYDITDSFTVGAAYKSKQYFDELEYNLANGDAFGFPACGGAACSAGTYKLDLDYPQQASFGIGYRITDSLTISGDVKWIDWSSTMDKMVIEGPDGKIEMDSGWEDQWVYAIGIDWAATDSFSLRAGFNYAKSPIDGADVPNNLILPAVVETHYTVGFGYRINNRWSIDAHYMYAPEKDFSAPLNTADATSPDKGQKTSLSEQSFGLAISYRF